MDRDRRRKYIRGMRGGDNDRDRERLTEIDGERTTGIGGGGEKRRTWIWERRTIGERDRDKDIRTGTGERNAVIGR